LGEKFALENPGNQHRFYFCSLVAASYMFRNLRIASAVTLCVEKGIGDSLVTKAGHHRDFIVNNNKSILRGFRTRGLVVGLGGPIGYLASRYRGKGPDWGLSRKPRRPTFLSNANVTSCVFFEDTTETSTRVVCRKSNVN